MSTGQQPPQPQHDPPPAEVVSHSPADPHVQESSSADKVTPSETDDTGQEPPQPQHDPTPAEVVSHSPADPHVQESSSAVKVTPSETDVTGAPGKHSTTDADPHIQQETMVGKTTEDSHPPRREVVPPHPPEISPAIDDSTQVTREGGDGGPSKPGPAAAVADPPVYRSSSAKKVTHSETDDTGAPGKYSKTDANHHAQKPHHLASCWKKFRIMFKVFKPASKESPISQKKSEDQLPKEIEADLIKKSEDKLRQEIEADLIEIKNAVETVKSHTKSVISACSDAHKQFDQCKGNIANLKNWKEALTTLKFRILPTYKTNVDEQDLTNILSLDVKDKKGLSEDVHDIKRALHNNVRTSVEFNDFEVRYNELSTELKLCLLCFSVFPKDAVIKRRLMVHWWVCEGFADEDRAHGNFIQLMEKGFIEPVNKNKSRSVGRCRMHPFYGAALAILAERAKFFNFDDSGKPTQKFSRCSQACLVRDGVISRVDLENEVKEKCGIQKEEKHVDKTDTNKVEAKEKGPSEKPDSNKKKADLDDVLKNMLKRVHLVINVKETHVEFKPDWFSFMSNVNFIHLGSWSTTDLIEVESTEFLEEAKHKEFLKFLSLQGLANVIVLPDSISHFTDLKILDLRACHNLESIPNDIGKLRRLTHLDMSECYLLEYMPKSLGNLTELEVLKGFFVTGKGKDSSCSLGDLSKLKRLYKLGIFTDLKDFPKDEHVTALRSMKSLGKLAITWGGTPKQAETDKETSSQARSNNNPPQPCLPLTLHKLDLKCFPVSKTPYWLRAGHLENLEKLYIRGGKFSDLGQYQDADDWDGVWPGKKKKNTWKVKELRLKYLSEIEMEWGHLQELFPDLEYLEQVGCPKLTFFPSDANGVWINKSNQ